MPSTIFRMSGRKLKLECHLLYSGYQEDNSDDIYTNRYHRANNSLVIYWLQNIRKRQLKYHLEYQTKDNSFTIFYPEYRTLTRMTPSIFRITRMKFIWIYCIQKLKKNSDVICCVQNIKKTTQMLSTIIKISRRNSNVMNCIYQEDKLNAVYFIRNI